MIKQITVAECDICGFVEQAKLLFGRYNEESYTLPDGWVKSKANPNMCICPDCDRTLRARAPKHNDVT